MIHIVTIIVMFVGVAFCGLAALGMLRFPDVYTRMHAASKAGPLGAGLVLLAAGIESADAMVIIRCFVGLFFLVITAPLSAHLLSRAALRAGIAPTPSTSIDESWNNK
jgi:multicomponent Na+:H+ antiporter subunit G